MESNPQSLTYKTFMEENSNPMKERLEELKNTYSINKPKIETQVYPPIPATFLSPIEVCGSLPLAKI